MEPESESFQNAREGMKPAETQTESTEAVLTELTLARMVSLDGPAADIKAGPMDDVLLGEGAGNAPDPPIPPLKDTTADEVTSRIATITAPRGLGLGLDIPTGNSDNPPSPPRRKFKSPFSWLSRNPSIPEKTVASTPPPLPARSGTTSSITTLGSETTGSGTIASEGNRESLKDRFKLVRMREEAGLRTVEEDDGLQPPSTMGPRSKSTDVTAMMSEVEGEALHVRKQRAASTPDTPLNQPTLNQTLPTGTAAGTSTGLSTDQDVSVDWDLWQAVVNEGPAAVVRTSADELNRSIARGIPSAIRGVIWQVLAQSKNQTLEAVYRDLANRGVADARRSSEVKQRPAEMKRHESAAHIVSPVLQKEAEMSSASSTRSQDSGLASPPGEFVDSVTSQEGTNSGSASRRASLTTLEPKRKSNGDAAALHKLEKVIKRDLGTRTSFSKFLMSSGLQNGLFGICKAYALFDEEVGYAQGMNFIVMPLLFNMPEDEAFCLFVRLMNHYGLRDMFVHDMHGLHLHLYQFERLLEDFEPAVYCHLHRRGVSPQLYATQWFLTLFAYRFPLQLVLRIYDLILSEGLERAILKFGIVLMQKNAVQLLQMTDMAVLTTFLKERLFDVYIDKTPSASSVLESGFFGSAGGIDKEVYRADALVQDACAVQITPTTLKLYTTEWEEKVRDEKKKQAAEDSLRAGNTSLSLRVRTLEEQAERNDIEHVQVASELVRTKVENQRLLDETEGLRIRVEELQQIVTAQPGEVEERLKQEMDRIMQRNIEVQNENRHLEEATAEMEGELVKTKLAHAEMQTELEVMRQKWHNISTMMNSTT